MTQPETKVDIRVPNNKGGDGGAGAVPNGEQRQHPGPGYWLKQARERRTWTQREAADMLNLSPRYIVAMEDETFDKLPAPAFARGYLRAYAKLLGLVGDEIIRRYEAVVGDDSDPYFRELVATRRQPMADFVRAHPGLVVGTIVALLATLLIVGGVLLWRSGSIERAAGELHLPEAVAVTGATAPAAAPMADGGRAATPTDVGTGPSAVAVPPPASADVVRAGDDDGDGVRTTAAAGANAILPGLPSGSAGAPAGSARRAAPSTDVDRSVSGAAGQTSLPAGQMPVTTTPAATATPAANGAVAANAGNTSAVGDVDQLRIALTEDCWVEVRDARGTRLYSGMARRGADLAISGGAPMTVVLGNAPAAKLTFNGRPVEVASHTKERIATLVVAR